MRTLEMWRMVVAKLVAKHHCLSRPPCGGPLAFLRRRKGEATPNIRQQQPRLWASSLSALLSSEQGVALFRSFLSQEFAEENLDFWLAVEEYKKTEQLNMATLASQIFSEYVASTAPKQVNVDAATRSAASRSLDQPTPELFDAAQRRVQLLMESDTYGRFLRSPAYLALLEEPKLR